MEGIGIKGRYDVVIVGAGPAGSSLGYILADKGFDVLLIDRAIFPRSKLCAGVITWKTRKWLEGVLNIPFEERFPVKSVSKTYSIYERSRLIVSHENPEPFYFVNRKEYDMELVSLAENKSCTLLFNQHVTGVDALENAVLTESGRMFCARVIVGADGANSTVRKSLHLQSRLRRNLILAFQSRVPKEKIGSTLQPISPQLFLGYVRWGYGWIFPHKESVVVGMAGLVRKNKNLKERYIEFLKACIEMNSESSIEMGSHPIPSGDFSEIPGAGNVLLIGDAAGLVDPLTGEGIYYAHRSAELASRAILGHFDTGKNGDLAKSYKRYIAQVQNELKIAKRCRDLVYSRFRLFAYGVVKSREFYLKVTDVIHGRKKYSQIPLISKGIKTAFE